MKNNITRLTHIALLITTFTNPCVLSVLLLFLISSTKAYNVREVVEWAGIILMFFVLIPAVWLYAKTPRIRISIKSIVELTIFLKQHPRNILILSILLGIPCAVILLLLEAPAPLISTITALIIGSILTALLNLFYKISFHLTGIVILIIMAAQAWGQGFLLLFIAVPPIFWAKYHLHEHTIPQLLAGIVMSVLVILSTWYVFDQLEAFMSI